MRDVEVFNGDATVADWTSNGQILSTADGNLALTLTKSDGGSSLASTRSMLYGDVVARFNTGRTPGLVTAFITMSGTHDEVDW